MRRHWAALNRFTEDATIPIDNNDCEQLMRRVATGRKNWLFKGSVAAGERAANLLTIIGSAIRNNLDVRAYLDDVLRRVQPTGRHSHHTPGDRSIPTRSGNIAKTSAAKRPTANEPAAPAVA